MLDSAGTEIRFVYEGDDAAVTLSCLTGTCSAQVFFGDFRTGQIASISQEPVRLEIERPGWFTTLDGKALQPTAFSHQVCRIILYGGFVCLHEIYGDIIGNGK